MIKALIFDFDGLILDTETAWFYAYKDVLYDEFEFDLPLDDFVQCVGADDNVLFSLLDQKINDTIIRSKIRDKAQQIHQNKIKTMPLRDGILNHLKSARNLGMEIAICTSSKKCWADKHLYNLGIHSYFDFIVSQDDVENIKPDPELFEKTLDILNITSEEAIVYEDSMNGLISAQKANLPVVLVPNPVTEHLPFQNYLMRVDSLNDITLEDVLQQLKVGR